MPTIKNRRATKAQWSLINPVLASGEIGVEIGSNKVKVGNGLSTWNLLKYVVDEEALNATYATHASVEAQVPPAVAEAIASDGTVVAAASAAVTAEVSARHLVTTNDPRIHRLLEDSDNYALIESDVNGKVSRFVDQQGRTWVELHPDTIIDGLPEEISSGSGYAYVITDRLGRIAFGVLEDGSVILGDVDLDTSKSSLYVSTYSEDSYKIVSGPDIVRWGDSLSAQGNYTDLAARTGRTVHSAAVGGETSLGIAARNGAMPYLMLPVGGEIPASGGVVVTFTSSGGGISYPLLQGAGNGGQPMRGTLSGVKGVLTLTKPTVPGSSHAADDYYTFTRDASGTSVSVTRPAPFITDHSIARRGDICIFWVGRNNLSTPDRVLSDIAAMIQHMTALDKRFLVLSVTNGAGEGTGTSTYNNAALINSALLSRYGRRFLDVRKYMVDYGLSDLSISATAQDTADIAADIPPVSLRTDAVHFTAATQVGIINPLIESRLRENGWI